MCMRGAVTSAPAARWKGWSSVALLLKGSSCGAWKIDGVGEDQAGGGGDHFFGDEVGDFVVGVIEDPGVDVLAFGFGVAGEVGGEDEVSTLNCLFGGLEECGEDGEVFFDPDAVGEGEGKGFAVAFEGGREIGEPFLCEGGETGPRWRMCWRIRLRFFRAAALGGHEEGGVDGVGGEEDVAGGGIIRDLFVDIEGESVGGLGVGFCGGIIRESFCCMCHEEPR